MPRLRLPSPALRRETPGPPAPKPVNRGTIDIAGSGSGALESVDQIVTNPSGLAAVQMSVTRATDKLDGPRPRGLQRHPPRDDHPHRLPRRHDRAAGRLQAHRRDPPRPGRLQRVTETTYDADGSSTSFCRNYSSNTAC
jgi:hypothetical protein